MNETNYDEMSTTALIDEVLEDPEVSERELALVGRMADAVEELDRLVKEISRLQELLDSSGEGW